MTSRRTSSVTPGSATIVFLDANILAKPVTRTLLMVGGMPSGFHVLWSETAEREAARHLRLRAVTPSDVRRRFEIPLGPTGDIAGRFASTKGNDRQILADADAARARFLVTEDVDDFAEADLIGLGLSAVNPDLFLAERLTRDAYALVIDLFVERQVAPPTTAAPMTRNRANADGTPGERAAEYYGQRAALGLLITEGTQPSADGQGYVNTPGIHAPEHIEGWRKVADAVHEGGGHLFVQLMHVGRTSHPDNTPHHRQPVAPSAIAPGKICTTPPALSRSRHRERWARRRFKT
jgi:hypothetical protein